MSDLKFISEFYHDNFWQINFITVKSQIDLLPINFDPKYSFDLILHFLVLACL